MRRRGISWFFLRGPMRAIVLDQMALGQEVMWYLWRHKSWSDMVKKTMSARRLGDPPNSGEKMLDRTTARLKLLRFPTNPSGWPSLLGQKCTVLRRNTDTGRSC